MAGVLGKVVRVGGEAEVLANRLGVPSADVAVRDGERAGVAGKEGPAFEFRRCLTDVGVGEASSDSGGGFFRSDTPA